MTDEATQHAKNLRTWAAMQAARGIPGCEWADDAADYIEQLAEQLRLCNIDHFNAEAALEQAREVGHSLADRFEAVLVRYGTDPEDAREATVIARAAIGEQEEG